MDKTLDPVDSAAPQLATIEDYLEALKRRKLLPVLCMLLALALAWAYLSLRTETYTATARVLVGPTPVGAINNNLVAPNLVREAEVVVSDTVARSAVELLGLEADPLQLRRDLEVDFQPESDVMRISFTDAAPLYAANVSNAFANAYVTQRVGDQADFFLERETALTEQIETLDAELEAYSVEIGRLDTLRNDVIASELSQTERQTQLSDIASERQDYVTQTNLALQQRRSLSNELSELVAERTTQAAAAEFLREAAEPAAVNGVSARMLYVGAGLGGLLTGVVLAFLLFRLDRTATAVRDIEAALQSRVIGRIPKVGWRGDLGGALVMATDNRSVAFQRAREAYRRLRTSVEFLRSADDRRSFVVTSTQPGEGKSATAANLAIALAARGASVALVSADLRRPTLETYLGIEEATGLSDFLGGQAAELTLASVEGHPNLQVVPSGHRAANAGELLSSELLTHVLSELRSSMDYVVIDSPPVGAAADALVLAPQVDGALIVVDGTQTTIEELLRARSEIVQSGGQVAGAIINRDRSESGSRLGRRNRYAYERAAAGS